MEREVSVGNNKLNFAISLNDFYGSLIYDFV